MSELNTRSGPRSSTDDGRLLVWKASWLPGSETFVRNQVDALSRWRATTLGVKRVESAVAATHDLVPFGDSFVERACRQAFLRTRRSRRIESLVTNGSFDVIHAHFLPDATLIEPIARQASVPLVITVHGRDVTALGDYSPRALERMRATLSAARKIVAVSGFIADKAISLGAPEDRVLVHHTGIPVDGLADAEADPANKEWDLCFVGRLVEKKGISDGIEAVAQKRLRKPLSMAIVGDGPLRSELIELARARGVDVTLLGGLTPEGVRDVLSRSAVFVGPSKTAQDGDSEGFGMVFLEAALAGLPVVSYRHGGVPEAVEHGVSGLLSTEGDVLELAQSIVELLRDDLFRGQLGRAGGRRVRDRFDVRLQTHMLEAIYDEAAGR